MAIKNEDIRRLNARLLADHAGGVVAFAKQAGHSYAALDKSRQRILLSVARAMLEEGEELK